MLRRFSRYGLAAFAAGAVALVLLAIATESGTGAKAQAGEYTIELLDSGPNPALCQVNRNDSRVYFLNKSSVTRQIQWPAGIPVPLYDTGPLEPGERSRGPIGFTSFGQSRYHDILDEGYEGTIAVPFDPGFPSSCSPLPPTPTPTPTPTMTPTPSPTPPPQKPPACEGLMPITREPVDGCGIAGHVAQD